LSRLPVYEAQNRHIKKYGLEDQDWRPGMMEDAREAQEK
jgi:hypothetical protein